MLLICVKYIIKVAKGPVDLCSATTEVKRRSACMSALITAANIDLVIKKNNEIRDEGLGQTMKLQTKRFVEQ